MMHLSATAAGRFGGACALREQQSPQTTVSTQCSLAHRRTDATQVCRGPRRVLRVTISLAALDLEAVGFALRR
jgi:hypothetical protein